MDFMDFLVYLILFLLGAAVTISILMLFPAAVLAQVQTIALILWVIILGLDIIFIWGATHNN